MSSKRFKKLPKNTNTLKAEPINNLLSKVKENCTTKFDESVDLNFLINNKQKKSEVNLRTVVNMPGGTGKTVKVAVVCEDDKADEAREIVRQVFPKELSRLDAYGAFNMTYSKQYILYNVLYSSQFAIK